MKHILLGIAGLLMLALNIVYSISRQDAAANSDGNVFKQSENAPATQLDCTHDCAACGKCFPEGTVPPESTAYNLTVAAEYRLTAQ